MIESFATMMNEVGKEVSTKSSFDVPPFAKDTKPNKINSFEEANKSVVEVKYEKKLAELSRDYTSELKKYSDFPDTIGDINIEDWEKISVEENLEKRMEFKSNKSEIIENWEQENNMEWPTYDEDVVNENGNVIRQKGDKYDAHHKQPLQYGGENTSENITPLHADNHYDHKGIHSTSGSYGQINNILT